MYLEQVQKINEDLKKTGKAIVAFGDSFVQGQGAVNDELYTDYKWEMKEIGVPLTISISEAEKSSFLKKYPLVKNDTGMLNFIFMEYENAFVNVLCKKYFEGEYTPINFGIRGCGNRGTIKEIYLHGIEWDLAKELIVIYCPSGPERFDFANDAYDDHYRWKCIWPNYKDMEPGNRKLMWEGYAKHVWSDKAEAIEQICHVQELLLWCKYKNAKLVITPGFDRRYTKTHFENVLSQTIKRDMDGKILERESIGNRDKSMADLFPWEYMFAPQGHQTFADLAMSQEPGISSADYFFQFLGKGSPNKWITPCSHPSAKGHDLFARLLYEHLK